MVTIKIKSKSFRFNLEFHGKFSFVLGNSGSRKSHFLNLCNKIATGLKSVFGEFIVDGRKLKRVELIVLDNKDHTINYTDLVMGHQNCLFIIDEFSEFYHSQYFSSLLMNSNNYFIMLTRKVPGFLPVNVQSVYVFERDGNFITNHQKYLKFNHFDLSGIDYILTEDSVSGREFFVKNFPKITVCSKSYKTSAGTLSRDNSQLHFFLERELNERDNILVVYDSSAYAPYYEYLLEVLKISKKRNKTVKILDWESFECYILSTPMFHEFYDIDAATCKYVSVERLCTHRLEELIDYHKRSLPNCFNRFMDCNDCKRFKSCLLKEKRDSDRILISPLDTITPIETIEGNEDFQKNIDMNIKELNVF